MRPDTWPDVGKRIGLNYSSDVCFCFCLVFLRIHTSLFLRVNCSLYLLILSTSSSETKVTNSPWLREISHHLVDMKARDSTVKLWPSGNLEAFSVTSLSMTILKLPDFNVYERC